MFGFYVSLFPIIIHSVLYILATNGIVAIFISLYIYIDAACVDFQYSINEIDVTQADVNAISKQKLHFIEIVSLHRDVME